MFIFYTSMESGNIDVNSGYGPNKKLAFFKRNINHLGVLGISNFYFFFCSFGGTSNSNYNFFFKFDIYMNFYFKILLKKILNNETSK